MSLFDNWFLFNLIRQNIRWFLFNLMKQNMCIIIVNCLYFEKGECKINVSFLASRTDKFKITEDMLRLLTAKIYMYCRTEFIYFFLF